jgi:small subunit ribosomal protein S4
MGFGVSRAEARQIVRHKGVLVNGKPVDIPSYSCQPGDVVELLDKAKGQLRIKAALAVTESRGFPEWLEVDGKTGRGVFKSHPARQDLPASINEALVVELYSR